MSDCRSARLPLVVCCELCRALVVALALVWPVVTLHLATAAEDTRAPVLTVLERTTEPLLKADRPWEDFNLGYCTVLRIGEQWHLWYDSYDRDYRNDNDCYSCYARSKDGIHWDKPSLGIYAYHGSKDNNILGFGTHSFTVFYDKSALPIERFKAIGVRLGKNTGGGWWVYGATSPDGLHWKWSDKPLLNKNSDTANVCIRDGNVYRLYVRMWSGPGTYAGYRMVGYSESSTFGAFPDPVVILRPDQDDPADFHLYNAATTKLRDDLYLMAPSGFFTKTGKVLAYAAFSRDGQHFQRLGRTPLLDAGKGFDKMGIYVGAGAIPARKAGTYWIYYLGTASPHDGNVPSKIHYDGGIGRFLLKLAE
jgi:hypothetical protein